MGKNRKDIQDHELQGFKYFKAISKMLERLHDAGCQRDKAGNRQLHMDQYVSLILLYMFNPICRSLRSLQQVSELKKVQKFFGAARASLGSLSEASTVFDSELLKHIIQELSTKLDDISSIPGFDHSKGTLTAVDGSVIEAVGKMAWALWRSDRNGIKVHCQYEILRGVAVAMEVTDANANEKAVLSRILQPDRIYVLDRGYAKYALLEEIVNVKSSFVCRIRDNAIYQTIELCLSMYDWAKFRRKKGAVKLHLMLNHQGCLPQWAWLTDGKVHEVNMAKTLEFEPGTIVAVDRGYIDYDLFDYWTGEGVWFVTRAKKNMAYEVVTQREVPDRGNVLRDEEIRFTGYDASHKYPHTLRRVVVWDDENQREIVLLTNHMEFAASTIGRIYKDRWQIELFFKAIKQTLKIKTFVGTSENAVQIQIWTALLCMLILKILQMRSTFGWSLSNLAAMLRFNLLTYRDLWGWLNKPYQTPAIGPPDGQLLLFE